MSQARGCLWQIFRAAGWAGLIGVWLLVTLAVLWPVLAPLWDVTPEPNPPADAGVNYLIIAPTTFSAAADAWAVYRQAQGYQVQTIRLAPAETSVETIRHAIQTTYQTSGAPYPFFVLLLGHAHAAEPAGYLPVANIPLDLPEVYLAEVGYDFIASDDAYLLDPADGRLWPIAIGRLPVASEAEALDMLARTQAYETQPPTGDGRLQIELLASYSGFGPTFDSTLENLITYFVQRHMPADYRWHLLYGHPQSPYAYPIADFPNEAVRRLEQSALLVNYIGHGSGDSVGPAVGVDGARSRILNVGDAARISRGHDSLVLMLACSAGEYDQAWSLAEMLTRQPGGPVAVYAASRITLPAANTILGKDLWRGLLVDPPPTLGEWIRQAESDYANPGADRAFSLWFLGRAVPTLYSLAIPTDRETPPLDANFIYGMQQHAHNIFGDPALRLALPQPDLSVRPRWSWQPAGRSVSLSGAGPLPAGQRVTLSLRASPGEAPPSPSPTLEARYIASNTNLIAVREVEVDSAGAFSGVLTLPAGWPTGRYIVQALAVEAGVTHVGSHVLHLGWPPIGQLLAAPLFWQLLLTSIIIWRVRRHTSLAQPGIQE